MYFILLHSIVLVQYVVNDISKSYLEFSQWNKIGGFG